MPAKDFYHETVRNALTKDGWTITHDPLTLRWGRTDLFVDLGAEKVIAAEKNNRKIAVEVKSFSGRSRMNDLEKAIGQYTLYSKIVARTEPDREVYLAVQGLVFTAIFEEPVGQLLLEDGSIKVIVFDEDSEEVVRWIG